MTLFVNLGFMKFTNKHFLILLILAFAAIGSFIANEDLWYAVNPINSQGLTPKP